MNLEHPLVKLSQAIDWSYFETEFGKQMTSEGGHPSLPVRLIVGLHYLKALYDESDESVVNKWVENPYWQYFCGEETFQHQLPCHPTSLPKWRRRIGVEGVEKLLGQVLRTATQQEALKPSEIAVVNVDTTVQEKAVAFPTDARLYDKAMRTLVRAARKQQVRPRQSDVRLGKQALFQQSRYAAARQGKRAKQQTRKSHEEIETHSQHLATLTHQAAPELVQAFGIGVDTAAEMLITFGDNAHRVHSEAAFAKMCGVCPISASSGKTVRHRLNRGGNRQANAALCRVVIVRMRWHEPTQAYVTRRTAQGLSKREIIRCLKRYVAREIYHIVRKTYPVSEVPEGIYP